MRKCPAEGHELLGFEEEAVRADFSGRGEHGDERDRDLNRDVREVQLGALLHLGALRNQRTSRRC